MPQKTEVLRFRVSADLKQRIEEHCAAMGTDCSKYLRELAENDLKIGAVK